MQFVILSLIVGVPLFTFHVSLGQLLASGVIDMWSISPIFKGIGIALLLSQAMLGIYSIIGVSWMFVYFRDSFITKQDVYRWAEPLDLSREDGLPDFRRSNATYKLEETVPDYFNGVVLQRQYLLSPPSESGSIKFSVAFNLAVAWLIVFISLSKGLKSYGKVIYVFSAVPVMGLFVLCAKMLGAAPGMSQNQEFFLETDWNEFFLNTKSWTAAFVESFATWGMLGASAMQIASHNKQKNLLPRDTGLVIIITLAVLILSSFLAHTCYQLILAHGFLYSPSSFEKMSTYRFLHRRNSPQPPSHYAVGPHRMPHNGLFLGERVINPSINPRHESGYQALRFATELVPATFALLGADKVSPFWSVLFYFVLTLFGIAQQLAIWHCVVSGIIAVDVKSLKPWATTITFFTCLFAFIIGLPMTSELGIFVIYYIDYCIGSSWWLVLLYLLEIGAVFMVRGRPYSGETVVATLFSHTSQLLQSWVAPMLSFIWNVILPVALMLLSTTIIKNGGYKVLYNWQIPGYDYWPVWGRQAGCLIQLAPLVLVPIAGVIQTIRYLTTGPPDIFERIQLLYRPRIDLQHNIHDMAAQGNSENSGGHGGGIPVEDPPPKYTPPPSYSTATGARIAKLLRQSLRRSVRGIRNIRSALGTPTQTRDTYDVANPPASPRGPPPPNYAAVLVEINQSQGNGNSNRTQITIPRRESEVNEVIRRPHLPSDASAQGGGTMTASDVANILRSSLRRQVLRSNSMSSQVSSSVEHLVRNAVPINQDSLVFNNENIKNNSTQSPIN
ncbi:unnamed protein product [Bemisia tabaci]|uniref:Uncharacterized protein n=1 Tax=Bemisia tabaci TaxID=7038 RepID=A0A9P0F0W9_BEMTA|nr:unnamed protein product [Bemisia tabaci]